MSTKKKTSTKRQITVRFAVLGDDPRNVKLSAGSTLEKLIQHFGLKGLTVRVNGETGHSSALLFDEDTIVAVPQTKGG